MAFTVIQYAQALKARQIQVARKVGIDILGSPLEIRILLNLFNASLGVLVRLLVLKNVITDAELIASLDAAMSEPFQPEPVQPVVFEPAPPPEPPPPPPP